MACNFYYAGSFCDKFFVDLFIYECIPYTLVYSLSGIVITVITWLFIKELDFKNNSIGWNFLILLYGIISAALSSCLISGIINYILIIASDYHETWNGHYIIFSLMMNKKSILPGLIFGRIPITLIDRLISTFLGCGISFLYKFCRKKIVQDK